ncbi:SpoIIE family protein phosphatase [Paludibacterium purpuratum]|uniref:Stage II sporulation protein E n=1 Tax=Paludibacterium purpuratum TaxID=1144873 RepID=A0A4R7B2A6_9NEIS|nr:SpoIIE family protein phosphatase [Paludibacterium purpuratum]TDR73888.1 stage II sporulation protein E [Paludibacterium purpuratum]
MSAPASLEVLDCGVAFSALDGAADCGDHYLLAPFTQGMLIAAVDGLGHGPEASLAAQIAVATLARHAGSPLAAQIAYCHEALRKTRGVAMSAANLDTQAGLLEWIGVGNVDGVVLRARKETGSASLLPRGGVVGYRLPPLRVCRLEVFPGDVLIFTTDGVASSFQQDLSRDEAAQTLADRILARHGKQTDDALVLVTRYRGAP